MIQSLIDQSHESASKLQQCATETTARDTLTRDLTTQLKVGTLTLRVHKACHINWSMLLCSWNWQWEDLKWSWGRKCTISEYNGLILRHKFARHCVFFFFFFFFLLICISSSASPAVTPPSSSFSSFSTTSSSTSPSSSCSFSFSRLQSPSLLLNNSSYSSSDSLFSICYFLISHSTFLIFTEDTTRSRRLEGSDCQWWSSQVKIRSRTPYFSAGGNHRNDFLIYQEMKTSGKIYRLLLYHELLDSIITI